MSEIVNPKAALHQKALDLPQVPGVYIIKNKTGKVVYIGKSKSLKARVSQYFASGKSHDTKTKRMVASAADFEFITTNTELEALIVESKLIRIHQPRYNILLKHGKNFPYIKVSYDTEFPTLSITRKRISDNARYYGPYSNFRNVYEVLGTVRKIFKIHHCKHVFPRDIGKVRPCLYAHIEQCVAPCKGKISAAEYQEIYNKLGSFLRGNNKEVQNKMTQKMNHAAEGMMYELAAQWRDRLNALMILWNKQKVAVAEDIECDVVALHQSEAFSCLSISSIRSGALIDIKNTIITSDMIINSGTLLSLICEIYSTQEHIPRDILFDFALEADTVDMIEEYLSSLSPRAARRKFSFPKSGEKKALCDLTLNNAREHALHYQKERERENKTLVRLAALLNLEVLPSRIEAVDISNLGNEFIYAGLVSYVDTKPNKLGYRTYKIRTTDTQDDYASMREVVTRRVAPTATNVNPLPDLLLLDGGRAHVRVIKALLDELGVDLPVFGMVKDEHHKTRTLTDGDGDIDLTGENAVFTMIYKIQEEVHRYSAASMSRAKINSMKTSTLESVPGIGAKKANVLLEHFEKIDKVKRATVEQLVQVKGITEKDALAIVEFYKKGKKS